jgi:hypothetical protein
MGKSYSGRRRRRVDRKQGAMTILNELLQAPVKMTLNGRRGSCTVLAVILLQLLQKSGNGDARASRILLRYREFMATAARRPPEIVFIENEYTRSLAAPPPAPANE